MAKMKPTDPIVGPPTGTLRQALLYAAVQFGPNGNDHLSRYLTEVFRLAPLVEIDPAIVVAQSALETGDRETGKPWRSPRWVNNRNPAGLGIDSDDAADPATFTGVEAAWVHIWALMVACEQFRDLTQIEIPRDAIPFRNRWLAKYADPNCPTVVTIDDLNIRYVDQTGEPQATWAWDAAYQEKLCERGTAIFGETGGPMPESTRRPVIIVDAGHRSTDRSGNPAETALTDDMAAAYVAEFRRRGYEAYFYQGDLDEDDDPDETQGDLNTVALGIGAWIARRTDAGDDVLLVSAHYNGSHSPVHVIVPDNRGLRTAYAGGAPADDTAANNTKDVRLAGMIAANMQRAGLGNLFHGKLGIPGLMSETETGVGLDGFRLAIFAATVRGRDKAVRLVLEHGGTADPNAQSFAAWADATADAIDQEYGAIAEPPEPERIYPAHRQKAPDRIEAQGFPLTANSPKRFLCVKGTTLRTYPNRDAPAGVKTPAKAGRVYSFPWRTKVDDETWYVSSAGSWALAAAFEAEDA